MTTIVATTYRRVTKTWPANLKHFWAHLPFPVPQSRFGGSRVRLPPITPYVAGIKNGGIPTLRNALCARTQQPLSRDKQPSNNPHGAHFAIMLSMMLFARALCRVAENAQRQLPCISPDFLSHSHADAYIAPQPSRGIPLFIITSGRSSRFFPSQQACLTCTNLSQVHW